MDGYFQSALAANSLQQNINRNNTNNAIAAVAKVITHFPSTNKDFSCTELNTPDGIYPLLHEQFYETIAPQFITGTRASLINSSGYIEDNDDTSTGTSGSSSNNSSNGHLSSAFSMTPVIKSAALPIPSRTLRGGSTAATSIPPPLTASSSSSSSQGLHIVTSPQRLMTSNSASIGNNTSPYLPYSPSFPPPPNAIAITTTTPTQSNIPPHLLQQQQQQFASGSYMMSSSHDLGHTANNHDYLLSSSYTGNSSSVSSLSSLFGRSVNNNTNSLSGGKSTPQLSSSTRNNNIISTSITSTNSSKPKNHLLKTTSAFVLRFLVHENLAKLLAAKALEDDFLFFNIGSSFIWVDSKSKPKEPLSRIVFSKSYPLCHDINELTRADDHLDIVIGFSTGDIIWYDPLSCKYVRLNKGGCMVNAAVSMIRWIPGSEDLFVAVFKNGAAMIMDKEHDDQSFTIPVEEPATSWIESQFNAIRPHKSSKYNPVSYWKISKSALTDLAFSPDNIHMAITGADGQLRIIDYRNERLNDVFSGYYGKLTCADWSPDGKYIVTGGEDDLVTLWSFHEKKLVARCQGHKSFVTGVAFDRWRCDEQTYRFGSVGEDCNLILWDFSFSALQKPKHPRNVTTASPPAPKWPPPQPQPQLQPQLPISTDSKKSFKSNRLFRGFSSPDTSIISNGNTSMGGSFGRFSRKRSSKSSSIFTSNTNDEEEYHTQQQHLPVLHPPLKKNQAAILQPTTIKMIHADPCVSIQFRENSLVTTDRRGRIRIWGRP